GCLQFTDYPLQNWQNFSSLSLPTKAGLLGWRQCEHVRQMCTDVMFSMSFLILSATKGRRKTPELVLKDLTLPSPGQQSIGSKQLSRTYPALNLVSSFVS